MAWSRAILAMGLLAALLSPALSTPSFISMPTDADADTDADLHVNACQPSQVEAIVSKAVQAALGLEKTDKTITPGLLRILFHDCFPQGCDASILLNGRDSELDFPQNQRMRISAALKLIEEIRGKVHATCGLMSVSCTDITNLATRSAVMQAGGPRYEVPLNRKDSFKPAPKSVVDEALPGPNSSFKNLADKFMPRGFNKADLVALSGAHTIGKTQCLFGRRTGNNSKFIDMLKATCDVKNPLQNLDVTTPNLFDNKYYSNLKEGKGVFTSDMALTQDAETKRLVEEFALDQGKFFRQFSTSMAKLAHRQVGDGRGEIRANCFQSNSGQTVDLAIAASG